MRADLSRHMAAVAARLLDDSNKVRSSPTEWRYGTHGSLHVDLEKGIWFDHEQGVGGGVIDLICRETGRSNGAAFEWLRTEGFDVEEPRQHTGRRIVTTYPYRDEQGKLLFEVCRYEPKDFCQRAPDGVGGWRWSLKDVRRVLYRLPELIAAPREVVVHLVEGEKDADRLASVGLVATTCPGGANKWKAEYTGALSSRKVVILPDNDPAGAEHAETIKKRLTGKAERVAVMALQGLPDKGDVSDWLDAGGTPERLSELAEAALAKAQTEPAPIPPHAPDNSEDALALRFAAHHANRLRYVAAWGRWLEWGGSRWSFDDSLRAFDLARQVCREAATACDKPGIATALASAKSVAAVERLAKSDRQLAATVDQWDADPWLLNTPENVIDLRTGNQRKHAPEDYCTMMTAVAPGTDCPQWEAFLADVTDNDAELTAFLQRLAGYALTGSTREHSLAFLYGTGANGKSVFTSTLAGLLDGYHKTAPIETFTASTTDRHPTDLAMLRGARLVTAQETEEGRRWAESRIKSLTGGDRIAARFMRQDFFEFTPQFKLLIAGNHKPGLRAVDEAIRRRFQLIPFAVTVPPEKRDPELAAKLRREWPGILDWAITGCLAWQREGLNPPERVLAATADYLEGQDAVSSWLDECCERDPKAWESRCNLFASWKAWAERAGEFVLPRRRFLDALEMRGVTPQRRNNGRGFYGVRINRHDNSDAYWNR